MRSADAWSWAARRLDPTAADSGGTVTVVIASNARIFRRRVCGVRRRPRPARATRRCRDSRATIDHAPGGRGRRRRRGATFGDFERHRAGRGGEFIVRHDLVDHPQFERLAGGEARVAEPDLLGLLLADEVFEIPGAEPGVEAAHHRADLSEHRAFLGDRDVAHDLQDIAAADRIAVDRGDHRFLQPLDALIHVEGR